MTGIVNDLTSTFEIVRRLCGDKWKFLIICYLFNGPKRYGELQYHLDSIKPKVLTENLKELEDLGIFIMQDSCINNFPMKNQGFKTIVTNSGKMAHYAPGTTGAAIVFGSLIQCISAATEGRVEL